MTADEIRATLLQTLGEIAPEVDFSRVRADRPLRDQVDIDSYDFLNLLVVLHDRLRVNVPESDYAQLASLDSTVAYLAAHQPPD